MKNVHCVGMFPLILICQILPAGEICSDVLEQLHNRNLVMTLETKSPWYVGGEVVELQLVFENKSSEPLPVPSSRQSISPYVELLSPSYSKELNEVVWSSLTTFTPFTLDYKHCKTTVDPQMLAPRGKLKIDISDVASLKKGEIGWDSGLLVAEESEGLRRIRLTSGAFSLDSDIYVKKPISKDTRCLLTSGPQSRNFLCRKISLVTTDDTSLVFLSYAPEGPMSEDTLRLYLAKLERTNSASGLNLHRFERVLSRKGRLSFEDAAAIVMMGEQSIKFVADGKVVEVLDPSAYPMVNRSSK